MNCPEKSRLLACLDHELAEDEQQRVEAHLSGCPVCKLAFAELSDSLGRIDGLLSTLTEMPLRAAPAPAAHPRPLYLKRMAAGAAIAACALFAALLSRTPRPPVRNLQSFVALGEFRQETIQFGSIVRVTLPASAIDPSALDSQQKVQAEVLFGDDGRPRAIRLLN